MPTPHVSHFVLMFLFISMLFIIQKQPLGVFFIKRDSNTGEIFEVFQNTYFEEHLEMTAC